MRTPRLTRLETLSPAFSQAAPSLAVLPYPILRRLSGIGVAALRRSSPWSGALPRVLPPRARRVRTSEARCIRRRVALEGSKGRAPGALAQKCLFEFLPAVFHTKPLRPVCSFRLSETHFHCVGAVG